MKRSIVLFCLLALFTKVEAQLDSLNKIVEPLLNKVNAKTANDTERKALRTLAFQIQNQGQMLDETQHAYVSSLLYVDKAIVIFTALNDSINEANNRKFAGYLLGRFNRFAEGKKEIQRAIDLFHAKHAEWGVAVSQFDLSRLYEMENKIDSALLYCRIAMNYWKGVGNSDRVFLNQNMLINLLTKSKEFKEAELLQIESIKMAEKPNLHWQGIIDLYIVSANLYKANNELEKARYYHELYINKVSQLNKDGIRALSYFVEKN